MDSAKELVREVPIKLPNGTLRKQAVLYENVPKFCTFCKVIGDSADFCKSKGEKQAPHPPKQPGKQPEMQQKLKTGGNAG